MAVSSRTMTRQRDFSRLFIALAAVAGLVAVAPIVAAVLGYGGPRVGPRTAFASMPSGEYAVLGRSEEEADVVSVAWAANPGAATEIARVPHLPGFASTGAVSPDGRKLALVSVDGGGPSHPIASLNVVNLESGEVTLGARNVVPSQVPVWTNDGADVLVTRMPAGNEASGTIDLVKAKADGKSETTVQSFAAELGVYPVAFDSSNRLVVVAIGAKGSILYRAGQELRTLSAGFTRDWKLSPDGSELAFIETETSSGVRYLARTVRMDEANGQIAALNAEEAPVALGTAWNPATGRPAFGMEPGQSLSGQARVEALSSETETGFDVPLGFSGTGDALVVTHWDGPSFQAPGQPVIQLLTQSGRTNYDSYTRFYGWSAR
jgi:hypothetical protein